MKKRERTQLALLASVALAATLVGCGPKPSKTETALKKVERKLHLKGDYRSIPWKRGASKGAMRMALASRGIPLAQYGFTASKDGKRYSGMLVGTSPFSKPLKGATINAIVVPVKVTIGSTTFDPMAPDCRDANVSALTRFRQSPLTNDVPNLTMNGVDIGSVQFINGLRRAEFWATIQGSPAYQNELKYFYADSYELTAGMVGTNGITDGGNCEQIGVLNFAWLDTLLQARVPQVLTSPGMTSPAVVLFLLRNIVECDKIPPSPTDSCALGYHGAIGTSIQTYGVIDWDTSRTFTGVSDASVASHEIGEWMDDPLGTNPTPPWGGVGQVGGQESDCQNNWEVGDPLSGTLMPVITMNGMTYEMQELGFFSWFFNRDTDPSLGTGGRFSSNGFFQGPAKPCPPGGTQ